MIAVRFYSFLSLFLICCQQSRQSQQLVNTWMPDGAMTTQLLVRGDVLHVEADQYIQNSILYSTTRGLISLDVAEMIENNVAGKSQLNYTTRIFYKEGVGKEAIFNSVSSFVHKNKTHILLADRMNHCIRMVDRITRRTSSIAGQCMFRGQLTMPTDLTYLDELIYVTLYADAKIVQVDLHGDIKTIATLERRQNPYGIIINSVTKKLFITIRRGLASIQLNDSQNQTNEIVELKSMGLSTHLKGLSWIDQQTVAVADSGSGSVHLLNLATDTLTSVCHKADDPTAGKPAQIINGDREECTLYEPVAALRIGCKLYIGERNGMRVIDLTDQGQARQCTGKFLAWLPTITFSMGVGGITGLCLGLTFLSLAILPLIWCCYRKRLQAQNRDASYSTFANAVERTSKAFESPKGDSHELEVLPKRKST